MQGTQVWSPVRELDPARCNWVLEQPNKIKSLPRTSALAHILTASSLETLSQNSPAKHLPNSRPIEIGRWYIIFVLCCQVLRLCTRTALIPQMVKNLPAMQETRVRSQGLEDPLEKEMATHSSILAWRIPWTEEPGRPQSMELQESYTT